MNQTQCRIKYQSKIGSTCFQSDCNVTTMIEHLRCQTKSQETTYLIFICDDFHNGEGESRNLVILQ